MKWLICLTIGLLFTNCAAQEIPVPVEVSHLTPLRIDKTMILCLSPLDEFRSSFELAMQQKLYFHGVHAETSKQYLPTSLNNDEETEHKLAQLIEALPEKGFSKLLISAISTVEHTKTDAEGYFGDFERYHFVTHLFTIDQNGSSLVWTMCIYIYDYQVPLLSVQDFTNAIVGKMLEEGVLGIEDEHELKLFTL